MSVDATRKNSLQPTNISIGQAGIRLDPASRSWDDPWVHWLDRAGVVGFRLQKRRFEVFPEGWGDTAVIGVFGETPSIEDPIPEIDIVWSPKEEHRGYRIQRGSFTSPIADMLPVESRAVSLELIEPGGGSDRTVLLMPAWNDHGFETRRKFGLMLAERGVASVAFDIPFYGGRRVVSESVQAIRTVSDFVLMGMGAVREGRSVLAALRDRGDLGVSGYSMGGNLAAFVSALVPFPVAVAPLAASHSPGPLYTRGMIHKAVDWQALGGDGSRERLGEVLSAASVLDLDPLPHHATAVLVGGTADGFVPPFTTEALASHWPGSELRWFDAGHGTLLSRHRPELIAAVVDAFDRTFDVPAV